MNNPVNTTTEPDFAYGCTSPEIELLEIVRLAHLKGFRLSIEHQDETFMIRLTDLATRKAIEGQGPTFEAAWRTLPGAVLGTFDDRVAACGKRNNDHLRLVERPR